MQSTASSFSFAYVTHIQAWHSYSLAQFWSQTELVRRQPACVHCNCLVLGAALVREGSCELLQTIMRKLLIASELTPDDFSVHLEYS